MCFQHLREADVCTPRPTPSRVTTADGRSPGSRVGTFRRLPRTKIPRGTRRKIHRLQLRGQPGDWGSFPAPHSLLNPNEGTVALSKDQVLPSSQSAWFRVGALL